MARPRRRVPATRCRSRHRGACAARSPCCRPGRWPGARACRTARRCRCCARSAATRRRRRPARSTAATRSTSSATSSPRPGAAPTSTPPRARSSPPRRRSGTTPRASPCSTARSTPCPRRARPDSSTGATTIRIRGTQIGRLTQAGAFEPAQSPFQWDVDVLRRDGQWRISRLPDGVVVPLSIFRDDFRTVRTWFVDPTRQLAVGDVRYVPSVPAKAQAARVIDQLLAGPSSALAGAAVSELQTGARLRSNVAASPDGAVVVDLTRTGDLDATRPTAARRAGHAVARRGQRRAGAAARRRRAAGGRPPRVEPRRRRGHDRRRPTRRRRARARRGGRAGGPALRARPVRAAAWSGRQRPGRRGVGGVDGGRQAPRGRGPHRRGPHAAGRRAAAAAPGWRRSG